MVKENAMGMGKKLLIDDQRFTARQSVRRPFELDLSQDVCDRATRLAKTLFGPVDAQIVLVKDGVAWRSRDGGGGPLGVGGQICMDSGELLWVEDGQLDQRFAGVDIVIGPPYVRFYAAAPICLADGQVPGLLAVTGLEPKRYDASLAGRLVDLAVFVADEWARAQSLRAAESGRKEREALAGTFTGVVNAMPVSLLILDRECRVVTCNPRWAGQIGLRPEDTIGQPIAELRPDDHQRWRSYFDRVIEGEVIRADKVRYADKAGETRWMDVEMAPWMDADGAVGGAIVAIHEITKMVDALERVERSEQRLTLAMEIADIHVWEMDYSRRQLIKSGGEDTFFSEPKTYENLARDIYGTIDPRDRPAVEEAWRLHTEEGAPYRPQYRLVRSDGIEVWTSGAARLITDERGRPVSPDNSRHA